MSAAAARRRKQLEARKKHHDQDAVSLRLKELLASENLKEEATAYEALQLAQSQVRKKIKTGQYEDATELAYQGSMAILKSGRISVASQLLMVLAESLRETHTEATDEWIGRIEELHQTHQDSLAQGDTAMAETNRLERLEREFLRKCVQWSADLGKIRFGDRRLQELLGNQCWKLSLLHEEEEQGEDEEEENSSMAMQCDAVTHMVLAEKPDEIISWLKSLPPPTEEEVKMGHQCPPADRDALLTRCLLLFCVVENLRDANKLLRAYIKEVEDRDMQELTTSYMNKDDGKTPAHAVFGCMLLRVCEKDAKTGPLYSWLLRSFKKELGVIYKPQILETYTTKIGKVYFNIQPPPNMLNMIENMMGMGSLGGGMNPAMLQQMMAQSGGM